MNEIVTKRDLVEQNVDKVVDKTKALSIAVGADYGGTGFSNMLEVIESAKMMAMAGPMIPAWLRGNPGGCWGVILQAIEWKFSPLSVARMSFEVNGNIAYMSQLVHAVIEARAPLQGRLRCEYDGENGDRICIVTGTFRDDDQPQIYRSPKFKDISPKNSPLWKNDPDQQLWYFSSRAWCRRYAPDILMGVYAKDELEDNPAIEQISDAARNVSPDLHARLTGGKVDRTEGHQAGHAETELARVATGDREIKPAQPKPGKQKQAQKPKQVAKPAPKAKATGEAPKGGKGHVDKSGPKAATTTAKSGEKTDTAPKLPKTSPEYVAYADKWIAEAKSRDDAWARWEGERELRDDCKVSIPARTSLQASITDRFPEQKK